LQYGTLTGKSGQFLGKIECTLNNSLVLKIFRLKFWEKLGTIYFNDCIKYQENKIENWDYMVLESWRPKLATFAHPLNILKFQNIFNVTQHERNTIVQKVSEMSIEQSFESLWSFTWKYFDIEEMEKNCFQKKFKLFFLKLWKKHWFLLKFYS
jgi:hypothetical protein